MKKYITLLFFTALFSCEENNQIIDADNLLIGNWSHVSYQGNETTFKRTNTLPDDVYAVSFNQKGKYIEKTSGFCGTPPLTFFNLEGDFKLEDGLITINKNSYPEIFSWRIVSLTETTLVVKREYSEQEVDHRNLMELYSEIENLAYSVSCEDADSWAFTAYGTKACGGPQGYIPYTTQIDTTAFLQKVAKYSEQEKLYNIKWGIVSTCDFQSPPIKVVCENGLPKLKY